MQDSAAPGQAHAAPRITLLDGVRGLAICLVLLAHFFPDYLMPGRALEWAKKGLRAGWTGVDLFFVLSGFLITDILLRVKDTPGWWGHFYMRRALRILPLYLLTLAFTFWVLPWVIPAGTHPAYDTIRATQGWYWIHSANVVALVHGFGAMMSDVVSLSHFWSLAVEEHFYLLWPLLLARLPEKRLPLALGAIIAAAIVFRTAATFTLPEASLDGISVQTPARMDGLAMGALLTVLFRRYSAAALRTGAWVAFPLSAAWLLGDFIAQKGLWPGSSFVRTAGFTLVAIFYASGLTLLLTSQPCTWARRAVDQPVLRFFGKYSYGIYVLHGLAAPRLARWLPDEAMLARFRSPVLAGVAMLLCKAAISVALALLSWRLVEAPCLRWKARFDYRA